MKVQSDEVGGVQRLSFGEFDETFPHTSPIAKVLSCILERLGAWRGRSVVVAHWAHEVEAADWPGVVSFPYRTLFQSATVQLSRLPRSSDLRTALTSGWRLPRILLFVVDEMAERAITQLTAEQWRAVLEEEHPSVLLALRLPIVVTGFYHQRWISTYLPTAATGYRHPSISTHGPTAGELARQLLSEFGNELIEVSDQL